MNNITKKIVAIITTVTCAVWLIGPGMAQALTAAELQAQIDTLLATIATLQAQITAMQGGTSTAAPAACSGITFSRSLTLTMTGTDVKCLQAILNQNSTTQVAASGTGSAGSETTYFGALTKAGVVKFQELYAPDCLTPLGLTQGTGFVGAKTMAKLNGILAGTTPTTPTTPGTTLPTAAGLTVAMASDSPAATTIIADGTNGGQALVPYLKVNFSTPAGTTAKVTTLKLKRLGISNDSDIPMVYLYDGNTKLAEMNSLSLGVVTFTNSAGLFTVSGVKTITVKGDLYYGTTAGKTIGFSIAATTDVITDAAATNATFPINGNLMTTAIVSDLGKLTIATSTNAATIDPGTTAFEAMRITAQTSNQAINIYSIKFQQLGSILTSDISNLSLWVGATQIGSTVASMNTDRTVTFDFSAAPYAITSGVTKNISLKVDVVGGSTREIQFSIQRSTDIVAKDANYGVYVKPDNGTVNTFVVLNSVKTTVNSGNLIITKRTDSPSANVALNSTNLSLAKFDVKAVGEDIKVSSLNFAIGKGLSTWTDIKNGRILYDGSQVGTTKNQVVAGVTQNVTLNFTVPVGQTKTLEIKADIIEYTATDTANGLDSADTLTASLEAGTTLNAQKMTSLGSFNFPAGQQTGNILTVTTASLSAAKNLSVGNITTVYNVTGITIGSYFLTAGSAEGIDVSKITFTGASSSSVTSTFAFYSLGGAFTNLELYYGTTKIGTTITPNASDASNTEYSFYPSPALSLAAGQTIQLDLKANVLNGALWTATNATQLRSTEGTGKVTSNAANITTVGSVAGQAITLSGAGVLTGAVDPSTPETAIAAMGNTGQTLGIWKLSANNTEDLTVSQIIIYNLSSAASSANVKNLTLLCGSAQLGISVSGLISNSGAYYAGFGGACVVPKGSNKLITLKGDITNYGDGAQAGAYLAFTLFVPTPINGLPSNEIIARGAGDYASTTARSTSTANLVYPYRTSLTSALTISGTATGRVRSATDKVATLALTGTASADALFGIALNGDDDAVLTNWATSSGSGISTSILVSSTTISLDGANSIQYTASTTVPTTTWAAVYTGALNGYSKLSLWLYSATTTARTVFVTYTTSSAAFTGRTASTTSGTLAANKWNYVELNLPSTLNATTAYVGVALVDTDSTGVVTTNIDAIKAYNNSITVNVSGNISTSTATGTPFYLKTTGGIERALGYYDGTSKVVLVPSAEIAVGASAASLDLITNTTLLMVADTLSNETLSLSSNLGTYTTPGDFRWYDQAVTVTSPITWMNGASPISVSLTY